MTQQLKIEHYNKDLPLIADLRALIKEKYADLFYAVIVHGSVATDEIIPYSDFDGLLIIKDEFANSKQLQRFKLDSMKLILKFDPLQHHGWFEISESQLLDYPEDYLPLAVLKHSKFIYSSDSILELKVNIKNKPDFKTTLFRMLSNIEDKATRGWTPNNIFQLKGFLSQLMLVPCLYYSAKNDKGIFKGESFTAVKDDFSDLEWEAIEVATKIRARWDPKLNFVQKKLLQMPNKLIRRAVIKYFPIYRTPPQIKQVNTEFYNSVLAMIIKIKKNVL